MKYTLMYALKLVLLWSKILYLILFLSFIEYYKRQNARKRVKYILLAGGTFLHGWSLLLKISFLHESKKKSETKIKTIKKAKNDN